ncbi:glycoside hydrolase [Paenibacillus psychroresistens]|uniref:Glycoside hydrolase n=1 Tax=Paenibacillus psychroresistens TaxID=1778678 RepID=A0A6B8RUW2_9BACL|nr:beta-galactosidase [Paenibacillus psychroresistens]QGQ99737.1 glycoside hydrolase [Paenibacillus psychroresistens]
MSTSLIIFYDPTFPITVSLEPQHEKALQDIGSVVGAAKLAEYLSLAEGGSFVNLHAPYFPKSAWNDILGFLQRGGGFVSIGGATFKYPVREVEGAWYIEAEQTAYHQELNIHEILPVDSSPINELAAHAHIPLLTGFEGLFTVSDTWNLIPHVTKSSDLPHQMGSSGPMDARLYPLLKGISSDQREVAAPVVLWENSNGAFTGGRWLFINQPIQAIFWERGGAKALQQWAEFCARGVTELWIKPNYASYEAGEKVMLTLQTQRIQRKGDAIKPSEPWTFSLFVNHVETGESWNHSLIMDISTNFNIMRIPVSLEITSGFYHILCSAKSPLGEIRILRQGFWGHDAKLLAQGSSISCDRDYFIKDGRPLPVVGMTYMTSDVARKFLFLPNAKVWDEDMAQMRKAGINWIRTGIWTAYRNIMQVDGHVSEEVLRAIDAFLLTAKKHDLQVTFTFFSFTPETWEGSNPYLDPRSLEAQKRFIVSIVSRHCETTNVDWDLINEPSMFDPAKIFSDGPRSCKDPLEQAAYVEYLKLRHGSVEVLQERWNMTHSQLPSFEAAVPPEAEEINFDVQDMHQGKKGTRWLDYVLFSMEIHNRWAKQLYTAIKAVCPNQLVTVGQDEGLGAQRPSPFFYAEAVDYTTVHSWWFNDHLLWDGIFAKTHHKPNLIQETGIMYVETPDGRAKRSELELRNFLERKYAYAFATGGAGAVQWIWNTNYYMDNANESHIGALRADGTEKPEANVSYDFGRFMAEIRDLFSERKLEDIAVVFPYSNDFSNRKLAFEATTSLTRIMSYEMKIPFRAVGEYHLESLSIDPPKLIILPSAHNFADTALADLLEVVKQTGATLLMTGPAGIDAYWRPTDRLTEVLGMRKLANVRREEILDIQGDSMPLSYGGRKIAQISKEVTDSASSVINVPMGKGRIIWSPQPVELNERIEPIVKLYQYAIEAAGCSNELEWVSGGNLAGVYGRKLSFGAGSLFIFVSEFAGDSPIAVKDAVTGFTYSFILEEERSVLFATDAKGRVTAVYRPEEVNVSVVEDLV